MSNPSNTGDGAANDFLVVGLGGSAGSIPSFREFFHNVPADSGMAYVVVLHLSPEHESHLAEVLQSASTIPVLQVRQRVRLEPDRVYVIPPNKSLSVDNGSLEISEITTFEERRAPIDIFFRTLADQHDSRAVCVIVSGSGSDGSMGLRRIKENNGLVLVQDPTEAAFGEMPRNCITTGLVDYVVPVADMPQRIIAYRDQLRSVHISVESVAQAEDEEHSLMEIFTLLRLRTGHDFTNYKRATVLRRIERRLVVRGLSGLVDYARYLREHHDETHALLRELLISVTNFFRDREAWEVVETTLLPRVLERKRGDDHMRVWIPGCSTGEEAYSMAMLLAERAVTNAQIFATDLDELAIVRARNGWYNEAEVADVSPERLRRFFLKDQDGYRVRRDVREMVLFAHHNLIKDPPFSHLDLISCRNVLIYLNRSAQQRAMEVLHFALEPGGYLFLGTSESIDVAANLFSVVDKESHIYQSRLVERIISVAAPPLPLTAQIDVRATGTTDAHGAELRPRERFAAIDLHQRLLEEYAAPSLVVDDQYNIVHLTARAGRFLQFPAGEATVNLLQVVRQELRIDLRSALFQSAQKRATVAARGLLVHAGDREERIDVVVRPVVRDGDAPSQGFFLVLFEESREGAPESIAEAMAVEPASQHLEEELVRVKHQMRTTIDQYEVQAEEAKAANEELQAMNEELRSTAEELETSQEELQSVNEELQTVNQELKVKIDETTHANDDMRNLMSSTEIGTIFVDRGLRVKLFTPRVRDIFNLIPGDIGRPLLDITNKLTIDDLFEDLERVLERLQTIEREVATRDGGWYLMRLLPYRTSDDRIDGVVLTFIDVTERRRAEDALQESRKRLDAALRTANMATWDWEPSTGKTVASDMLADVLGLRPGEALEGVESAFALVHIEDRPRHEALVRSAREKEEGWHSEFRIVRPRDGRVAWLEERANTTRDPLTGNVRITSLLWDITERKLAQEALNATNDMLEQGVRERTRQLEEIGAQRQHLLHRLLTSEEEERRRVARELHDEMGQHITALKVGLAALSQRDEVAERMKGIAARLDETIDRLTFELRPAALDGVGLAGAIGSVVDHFNATTGLRVHVHVGTEGTRFPDAIETTLYRVLQEAMTNVRKHANAKNVSVILERNDSQLQMVIEDDGIGFDADGHITEGYGLLGMRERVALVGGSLNIESSERKGTTLYVRVPIAE